MVNKRELRIVFMGTPEFAVAGLSKLVENGYNIVGVVTAPDKPAGRGRKLSESAVKKYALAQSIPILQPTNLKSEQFLEELKALNANLQVIVAFRMLPKAVWQMPKFGTFNLHASLLPQYRGAAPINWAVINGESKTGVTTFFIDEKIDTGAIIFKEETEIKINETAGELHDKLMHLGASLISKTVQAIEEGDVVTQIQKEAKELKAAPKIYRETCQIDWSASMDTIYNLIRGLSPYPAAWTHLQNGEDVLTVKIYNADKELVAHDLAIGTVILEGKKLKIAVKDGFIYPTEIQLPGKRKMAVNDLLNGWDISNNAKMF